MNKIEQEFSNKLLSHLSDHDTKANINNAVGVCKDFSLSFLTFFAENYEETKEFRKNSFIKLYKHKFKGNLVDINQIWDKFIQKDKLTIFVDRLNKIGIKVELAENVPWIYLDTINGKRVTDKYLGNHGFTVSFYPRKGEELEFTDIKKFFKLIRKYRLTFGNKQ